MNSITENNVSVEITGEAVEIPAPVPAPIPAPAPETESETLVKFSKPYVFEDQTYNGIDLAGLENLTAKDMIEAEKYLFRTGIVSPLPDQTSEYICFIAGKVSGQPVEFFKGLPPKDITRVKNMVSSFFYGED